MTSIIAGTGAYVLSRFTDQALADSLGLRTIRAGTDPLRWVSSHFVGLNSPQVSNMTDEYGADFNALVTIGASQITNAIKKLPSGWFQTIASTLQQKVLQDYIVSEVNSTKNFFFHSILRKCTMHTVSYVHKTVRTYNLIKEKVPAAPVAICIAFGLIGALFTPTLKFRYKETEAQEKFGNATKLPANVLLISKQDLSPLNIGLLGTLKNIQLPSWDKASKVALGITKLALAGAVAYGTFRLCPNFIESHKTALITGAVFALI